MRYVYPAVFTFNELGGYCVDFPDFGCCVTEGDTIKEASCMAPEALELAIEAEIEFGHKLPEPSFSLCTSQNLESVETYENQNTEQPTKPFVVLVSVDVKTESLMVTSKRASELLGVSPARVRQMLSSGQLAGEKRNRDNYVYLESIRQRLKSQPKAGRPRKVLANA